MLPCGERGVVPKVPEGYNRPSSAIEMGIIQRMGAGEALFLLSHMSRLVAVLGAGRSPAASADPIL